MVAHFTCSKTERIDFLFRIGRQKRKGRTRLVRLFFRFCFVALWSVWVKLAYYFLENFDVGIGWSLCLFFCLIMIGFTDTASLSCGLGPHAAPTICTDKFKWFEQWYPTRVKNSRNNGHTGSQVIDHRKFLIDRFFLLFSLLPKVTPAIILLCSFDFLATCIRFGLQNGRRKRTRYV